MYPKKRALLYASLRQDQAHHLRRDGILHLFAYLPLAYAEIGTLEPWIKYDRTAIKNKTLLIHRHRQYRRRIRKLMKPFMKIKTFDITNDQQELDGLLRPSRHSNAACAAYGSKRVTVFNVQRLGMLKKGPP